MTGSVIAPSASLGPNTQIGHFCVIGEQVSIGADCEIGHHVVIHDGTRIGNGVRIDDHVCLGKQPMRAANTAVTAATRQPPARIGDRCLIGAGAVIYAGCTLGQRVLVADLATLREEVVIGDFTIVGRGVAIENRCRVGRYCKLETNVYLTAYSEIEDRVFIAPGVVTSNDNYIGRTEARFEHFKGVTVRKGGRLGVGSVILPGKTIGEDAVVAAGALLSRDAEPEWIYAGVPARPLRPVPEEQKLDNQGWPD
jgi:UDP-2-acetamido-3-amino-2,3-dideoxy-glucuronate N-acetyltransferase